MSGPGQSIIYVIMSPQSRRDTIQLEGAVSTISVEYLLEFTSEYGISENLHPKIDERIFPTAVDWHASAPRDEMPIAEMDLFSLIRNPNPFKVKTGTRPRAAHEVPLLTATASHVIDMEDPTVASGSSRTPSTVERSSLDFDNKDPAPSLVERVGAEEHVQEGLAHEIPPVETAMTTEVVQEAVHEEEVAATEPPVNKRRKQMRRKRVNEEAEANTPPKVLRKDHASGPAHNTRTGKSLAAIGLDASSTVSPPLHRTL
ncbi:hypothetical protein Tco_0175575 [Tanacetum coccineum]